MRLPANVGVLETIQHTFPATAETSDDVLKLETVKHILVVSKTLIGRGDDTVGNPHRAQICQFDVFELMFLSMRAFRVYPLVETRHTAPCRAIRGSSISVSSTLPLLSVG